MPKSIFLLLRWYANCVLSQTKSSDKHTRSTAPSTTAAVHIKKYKKFENFCDSSNVKSSDVSNFSFQIQKLPKYLLAEFVKIWQWQRRHTLWEDDAIQKIFDSFHFIFLLFSKILIGTLVTSAPAPIGTLRSVRPDAEIKSSPKISNSWLYLKQDVFQKSPKTQNTFGLLFGEFFCGQELSKIVQSGHTGDDWNSKL